MNRLWLTLAVTLLVATALLADTPNEPNSQPGKESMFLAQQALTNLQTQMAEVKAYRSGPMVKRLYGNTFATGSSPQVTAESFIAEHAPIFGVDSKNLIAGRPDKSGLADQPMMWLADEGRYKFHLQYFSQESNSIPVFRSELRVLVRNETNYPAVLAVSSLKNLDGFEADANLRGGSFDHAILAAQADESGLTDFTSPELIVFAGDADKWQRPQMGVEFIGSSDFPEKFRYIVSATTGEILFKENMIIFEDVVGHIEGNSTAGHGAEQCEEEVPMDYKWARVTVDGNVVYTDERGDFTYPDAGTDPVTVESRAWGQWFKVTDYTGNDVVLSSDVTPPGPANFVHNQLNNTEQVRSQANAYVHSNKVRDWVLQYNATYPQMTQNEFPVSTNRTDGYCPGNAWYDYSSINFCLSGDGYPNTAWSSVIYHEYGHHLINVGGSGQDAYGEGMADCISVLILENPQLGLGFYGDCVDPLRNADNDFQYPCTGSSHYCGQLLSGCVWSTRDALAASSHGPEYRDVIGSLTLNSILLHTGTSIDPSITVDFLTLDDDDGNLANGSPHYYDIAAGFGAHNMDAPPLSLLVFSYPNGIPALLNPDVATTFEVVVSGQEAVPAPGTGLLYYRVDGGGYTSVAMTETSSNHYEATLPAASCFQTIDFYVSAETSDGTEVFDPEPSNAHAAFVATEEVVAFSDDFETDMGWNISGGSWGRGTPTGGGGQYGNPDPSSAYEGDNVLGYNLSGDYENSMPEQHVTSPAIDCSSLVNGKIRFMRYLNVEQPSYDHAYLRVSTDGTSFTTIWENDDTIEDNAWVLYEYDVSSYVDGEATVYIRFTQGTSDGSWQFSGWNVDNLELVGFTCGAQTVQITTANLPDWTVGVAFSEQLEATNYSGALTWVDRDGDLAGTGLTLATDGLVAGAPSSAGLVSFVAQVTDETPQVDEKVFSFTMNPAVDVTTTVMLTWTEGVPYSGQLMATGGTGDKTWSDVNGDLSGTGLLLTATGLVTGTPNAPGTINFTAAAVDQVGSEDQQALSIPINAAVDVTTTSLPDAADGAAYSEQLIATGGTGTMTWSDLSNDLSGSGLTLSSDGLVSGTPTGVQMLTFTASATDGVGSSDTQLLAIDVRPSYICGDINGSGDGPDIEDLTYLVDYMFQDGPPPPQIGAADVDGNGIGPDIEDLVYLVAFMFGDGPALICE